MFIINESLELGVKQRYQKRPNLSIITSCPSNSHPILNLINMGIHSPLHSFPPFWYVLVSLYL